MATTLQKEATDATILNEPEVTNFLTRSDQNRETQLLRLPVDALSLSEQSRRSVTDELKRFTKAGFLDHRAVPVLTSLIKKYSSLIKALSTNTSGNDQAIVRNSFEANPIGVFTSLLSISQIEQLLQFTSGIYTLAAPTSFINLNPNSFQENPKAAQKAILEAMSSIALLLEGKKSEPPAGLLMGFRRAVDKKIFSGKPTIQKKDVISVAEYNAETLVASLSPSTRALLERDASFAVLAASTGVQLGVLLTLINKIVAIEVKMTKAGIKHAKQDEARSKKDEAAMRKKLEEQQKTQARLDLALSARAQAVSSGDKLARMTANREISNCRARLEKIEYAILRIELNEAPVDSRIEEMPTQIEADMARRIVLLKLLRVSFRKIIAMKHLMQSMLTNQLLLISDMNEHEVQLINKASKFLNQQALSSGEQPDQVISLPK